MTSVYIWILYCAMQRCTLIKKFVFTTVGTLSFLPLGVTPGVRVPHTLLDNEYNRFSDHIFIPGEFPLETV